MLLFHARWCCETLGKEDLVTDETPSNVPHTNPQNKLSPCTDHVDNDEADLSKLNPSTPYYDDNEYKLS